MSWFGTHYDVSIWDIVTNHAFFLCYIARKKKSRGLITFSEYGHWGKLRAMPQWKLFYKYNCEIHLIDWVNSEHITVKSLSQEMGY